MKGKLYLIPALIGESEPDRVLPRFNLSIINSIRFFIVENIRTGRRFLIKSGLTLPVDELSFFLLNKHTNKTELESFLAPADKSYHIGLLSEAGVPCIADPGAEIVKIAHKKNIQVIPLIGPSSILLALMASGLNGQNFAFNGYLPIKTHERKNCIKKLEQKSASDNQSQIFIETPYRNIQLFNEILSTCKSQTSLCIACNITLPDEFIKTKTIDEWKKLKPEIDKKPVIFIFQQFI